MRYGKKAKADTYQRPAPKELEDRRMSSRMPVIRRQMDLTDRQKFRIQGKKASDLEWRVYQTLKRLGWKESAINFQADVLGGRMPGGQVLDFVVWIPEMPVVIAVNGDYWHARGETQKKLEKQKEAYIRAAWGKKMKYLAVYTADLIDDDTAYRVLLREVGRG